MHNIRGKAVRPIDSEAYEILRSIQAYDYIAYWLGNHFEDGDAKAFAFRASTTVEQMADLQKAYLRLMVILRSLQNPKILF